MKLVHLALIFLAVLAIAVADVFLKRAAQAETLPGAMKSPWLWGAVLLYLYQIFFVVYLFVAGWELSILGTLQAVIYAVVVVLAGMFFFQEKLSPIQILGIFLAFGGSFLIGME